MWDYLTMVPSPDIWGLIYCGLLLLIVLLFSPIIPNLRGPKHRRRWDAWMELLKRKLYK